MSNHSLTVYGNKASASATLATANQLIANPGTIGGGSSLSNSLVGTATGFGELWSQGNAGAWAAGALNTAIAPTGQGWFLDSTLLDGNTIALGNWTAVVRAAVNANTATVDFYYRVFVYSPSTLVYTTIGVLSDLGNALTTVSTTFTFSAQALGAVVVPVGSKLYIDLWGNITASTLVAGNTMGVVQSTVAGNGINGSSFATPGYDVTPSAATGYPRFVRRALGSTIIPVIVSQPLPYIDRGLLSTVVYESRTFVPRAFSGVYIPDNVMWVPRGLGATIQSALLRSLTLAGVGTLAPALSANTALSVTFAGVGTLNETLSLTTALSTTLAGVGTLVGTFSLSTALSVTLAGVGTLTGTLSTTGGVSLAVTMAGVGTLSGTLSLSTALSTTCAGVGTLSGTLSANTALSTTCAGVGTLAATLALSTALGSSLAGAGTLSGVFTIRVALFLTCAGMGSLVGSLSIPSLSFLTAIWVTRDMTARWITRDLVVAWTTRDEHATWGSRDESAAWNTRDEQASWKTRG